MFAWTGGYLSLERLIKRTQWESYAEWSLTFSPARYCEDEQNSSRVTDVNSQQIKTAHRSL